MRTKPPEHPPLTVQQVADRLGVSRRHVARLIADGELLAINAAAAGARQAAWRVPEPELVKFERRRQS